MSLYFIAYGMHVLFALAANLCAILAVVQHAIRKNRLKLLWSVAALLVSITSFNILNVPADNFIDPGMVPVLFQFIGAFVSLTLGVVVWKMLVAR